MFKKGVLKGCPKTRFLPTKTKERRLKVGNEGRRGRIWLWVENQRRAQNGTLVNGHKDKTPAVFWFHFDPSYPCTPFFEKPSRGSSAGVSRAELRHGAGTAASTRSSDSYETMLSNANTAPGPIGQNYEE